MAATRVIVSANTTASSFLLKPHLLKPHQTLNLCFNLNKNPNFLSLSSKKRLFSCKSLFKPEIITKEDGLPETLDYRVFFLEKSGKKVLSFWVFFSLILLCLWNFVIRVCWIWWIGLVYFGLVLDDFLFLALYVMIVKLRFEVDLCFAKLVFELWGKISVVFVKDLNFNIWGLICIRWSISRKL